MSTSAFNVSSAVSPNEDKIGAVVGAYANEVVDLLMRLGTEVIRKWNPELEPVLRGEASVPDDNQELLLRTLQAQGMWFQLLNIAEENAGMRRRRLIETERGPDAVPGTYASALSQAVQKGLTAEEVQRALTDLRIRPTITAHPTEAKRTTVLEIHRRIYLLLMELESTRWTPREREDLQNELRSEIELLWLTGELRLEKPSVEQEVVWGLHFFNESLYERAPEIVLRLEEELARHFPGHTFRVPPFFTFGSWIGGDRDGNPFVTIDVTRSALRLNQTAALRRYRKRLEEVGRRMSVARHGVPVPESFIQALQAQLDASGEGENIAKRNPGEYFRQYLVCMRMKLGATLSAVERGTTIHTDFAYFDPAEMVRDLELVEAGLAHARCEELARLVVTPLRREVEIFGFRTVSLDIRQNTTVMNRTLAAVFERMERAAPPAPDSAEWKEWLIGELERPLEEYPELRELPEEALETLETLRLIVAPRTLVDPQGFGNVVLSMTQSAADVLGVYLLAKYVGLFADTEGVDWCRVLVVPLFETIEDLHAAPEIMRELLAVPMVRRTVERLGGVHEVMIGYSDSNKDGGFFAANVELSKAQATLTAVGRDLGIPISFFHGRGGSVSRGGAPTGHAIAAQPAGSVHGQMRLTEQGEVASAKFANRGTAQYHMELLASSVLQHTLLSAREEELAPHAEFDVALTEMAAVSHRKYRELVELPGLVNYYEAASPVEELALLNIGSRPARRFGAKTLTQLRAIPWVFAWTQNRHLITGFYGVGTALEHFRTSHGAEGEAMLKRLFAESRLFGLVVSEVEKILPQVDFEIARKYAEMVEDTALRDSVYGLFEEECQRTIAEILRITGAPTLCERFPRFRRRLSRRLPTLNQVGMEQIKLIRRFRASDKEDPASRKTLVPLLLSINCIAAGLGWTG